MPPCASSLSLQNLHASFYYTGRGYFHVCFVCFYVSQVSSGTAFPSSVYWCQVVILHTRDIDLRSGPNLTYEYLRMIPGLLDSSASARGKLSPQTPPSVVFGWNSLPSPGSYQCINRCLGFYFGPNPPLHSPVIAPFITQTSQQAPPPPQSTWKKTCAYFGISGRQLTRQGCILTGTGVVFRVAKIVLHNRKWQTTLKFPLLRLGV